MSSADRRGFDRVEAALHVDVAPREGAPLSGPAVDLSLGGVRVRCEERPALGAWVDVTLRPTAPGAEPLSHLSALVVRHTADGIALCFLQMPEGSYDRMRSLVGADS